MRTTIDIPASDHALFRALARQRGVSLGKVLVDLAKTAINPEAGADGPRLQRDPETGFMVICGGERLVTHEDVRRFFEESE